KKLQSATVITDDKGGPELYVLYEPHCPFCARLYYALQDKDVTVHYLPVAFLSPLSPKVVATLLDSDNPLDLMATLEPISMHEGPMYDWLQEHKPDHDLPDVIDILK